MITIRRFSSEDQKAVSDLISSIMNEEFQESKSAFPTHDIDNIPSSYGGLGEAFFVALNGSKVIGTVAIKKEDDRIALLRRLFVAVPYRKQQLGLKLVDHALHFCDEVGYKEIVFKTTSKMVGAARVCEKKGFVQRAKIQLGDMELLKYAMSLRNGAKSSKK
jgi:GNAT superfamily N-acetyltransferase